MTLNFFVNIFKHYSVSFVRAASFCFLFCFNDQQIIITGTTHISRSIPEKCLQKKFSTEFWCGHEKQQQQLT